MQPAPQQQLQLHNQDAARMRAIAASRSGAPSDAAILYDLAMHLNRLHVNGPVTIRSVPGGLIFSAVGPYGGRPAEVGCTPAQIDILPTYPFEARARSSSTATAAQTAKTIADTESANDVGIAAGTSAEPAAAGPVAAEDTASPASATASGNTSSAVPAGSATAADEDSDRLTCMICLERFEQGQMLRTLPCLHSYHQNCIDPWLRTHVLCPVCKHDVRRYES